MKNLVGFLFLISSMASGQTTTLFVKAEQTVQGPRYEVGSALEFNSFWAIGGFYQQSGSKDSENNSGYNTRFYGFSFQMPLVSCQKILVSGTLKAGLVDEQFVVVVPSVDTRMMILPKLGVTVSTGFRHGYPSGGVGLVYRFRERDI